MNVRNDLMHFHGMFKKNVFKWWKDGVWRPNISDQTPGLGRYSIAGFEPMRRKFCTLEQTNHHTCTQLDLWENMSTRYDSVLYINLGYRKLPCSHKTSCEILSFPFIQSCPMHVSLGNKSVFSDNSYVINNFDIFERFVVISIYLFEVLLKSALYNLFVFGIALTEFHWTVKGGP